MSILSKKKRGKVSVHIIIEIWMKAEKGWKVRERNRWFGKAWIRRALYTQFRSNASSNLLLLLRENIGLPFGRSALGVSRVPRAELVRRILVPFRLDQLVVPYRGDVVLLWFVSEIETQTRKKKIKD